MRFQGPTLMIIALLILSIGPGVAGSASGSIVPEPDVPSLTIDLRFRLEGLEMTWNGKVILDRIDLDPAPSQILERTRERIGHAEPTGEEIHVFWRWVRALRVIGRFACKRICLLLGFPASVWDR